MRTLFFTSTIIASVAAATPVEAATFMPYTTTGQAMVTPASGFNYRPIFTGGETLPNGYRPVGIMDGIGAYALNDSTVRLFVNHELGSSAGRSYSIVDGMGGTVSLTGARVSFFDIDKTSLSIVNGGQAYDRIIDRAGNIVTSSGQIGGGLTRLCSSSAFEANSFGAGIGLSDRTYFAGEETSNGSMFALDISSNQLHAVPAMGRGAWENVTQIDTGNASKVGFILSDDTSGSSNDPGSPLYLYVGEKGAAGDGSYLDRNGLAEGKLYVWVSGSGDANPTDFNGAGSARDGQWVAISNFDPSKAGTAGYDALGYADQSTLRTEAGAVGAFRFSRPEDVATNPGNSTLIALASTGSSRFGGADTWGTVYTIDTVFDADGNPVGATTKIIYDGNDDLSRGLRSPDNLTWAGANKLVLQEDQATDWTQGSNLNEASIVELTLDGIVRTIGTIDRSATNGFTDFDASILGAWETSGILDVSLLFGREMGSLFIGDVQAHGLQDPELVEGGQLFFLSAVSGVPEPGTWAMMIGGFGLVGGAMRRSRKPNLRVSYS